MNVVLSIKQKAIQEAIAIKLIPEGITALSISSLDELAGMLPEISKIAVIEEEFFKEEELYATLKQIRAKPDGLKNRIALLSKKTYSGNPAEMAQKGIDFHLQSGLTIEFIANKIMRFIYQFCTQHEQRTYVRMNVKDIDNINVRLPDQQNSHFYQAKITDISMGGIAIELPKGDQSIKLLPNMSRIQLKIQNKTIITDLQLVKSASNVAAFRFTNLNEGARDVLAAFIYTKIQDQLKV
jgi:hypothetical protein